MAVLRPSAGCIDWTHAVVDILSGMHIGSDCASDLEAEAALCERVRNDDSIRMEKGKQKVYYLIENCSILKG